MNITFRDAVIISVVLHSAIFLPIYNKNVPSYVARQKGSITIDYIKLEKPELSAIATQSMEVIPNAGIRQVVKPSTINAPGSSEKDVAETLAVKQARIKSTSDYIGYYQMIRDKIRQKLRDRYRTYYGEGDTSLIFVLRDDGKLISVKVGRGAPVCDQVLINTAIQSVKDAAPFAPFPKALSLPQLPFTLAVSFKKQ